MIYSLDELKDIYYQYSEKITNIDTSDWIEGDIRYSYKRKCESILKKTEVEISKVVPNCKNCHNSSECFGKYECTVGYEVVHIEDAESHSCEEWEVKEGL